MGTAARQRMPMAQWCRAFILFHGKKHPQEMGNEEIAAHLDHVAKWSIS